VAIGNRNQYGKKLRLETTMSALEQEIVEKFQQLDTGAKQRVLAQLESAIRFSFDYTNW
jgi:hypothetical protein